MKQGSDDFTYIKPLQFRAAGSLREFPSCSSSTSGESTAEVPQMSSEWNFNATQMTFKKNYKFE